MALKTENKNGCVALKIDGDLTIYNVADLRDELHTIFSSCQSSLSYDLTDVQECDTAGIQLLCAMRNTAIKKNIPMSVSGISAVVRRAAGKIGIDPVELFENI